MINITDTALSLAATGLPVFPCNSEKKPLVTGWQHKASTDQNSIRTMFSVSSAAMIGVPTGEASGFFAVDLDFRHGAGEWHEAKRGELPATRIHRTMNGGLHYLFKTGARGIRNSTGKLAQGVDVRGDGGYIIFPPSAGYSIDNQAEIADAPEWLVEAALAANSKTAPAPAQPVQATPPRVSGARPWHSMSGLAKATQLRAQPPSNEGTPYGRAALESACQEIRAAIDGAKHEVINRAAYSIGGLVSAGEIVERDAFADLSAALGEILHRCKDRKAAQNTLRRAFDEGRGKARSVPDMPLSPPIEVHPAAAFLEKIDEASRRAASKPLPVADRLMDVPGALGMFVDYCNATAISPQPFLALAAGITAIGALAGRRYRTETNLRTNIYTVGVADSGGGKDHARKCVREIFYTAGLTQYLGGDDIASATGLHTALVRYPAQLFAIDEFGDWLRDVLSPKAPPHRKAISARLKTLYSDAKGFAAGSEYSDQSKTGRPREDIINPHACLLATTTPRQFFDAIGTASMEDGLVARLLVFVTPESYPDRHRPEVFEAPSELVEAFKTIAAGADHEAGNLTEVMAYNVMPQPYLVPYTDGAREAAEAMARAELKRQREENANPLAHSIIARMTENALKLALVRSISRHARRPVIDETDIAWGRALSEHCVNTVLRDAADNVADTPYARNVNLAKQIIRKHGPITGSQMFRKGFRIDGAEREKMLNALMASGEIVATKKEGGPGKGPGGVYYSIAV